MKLTDLAHRGASTPAGAPRNLDDFQRVRSRITRTREITGRQKKQGMDTGQEMASGLEYLTVDSSRRRVPREGVRAPTRKSPMMNLRGERRSGERVIQKR